MGNNIYQDEDNNIHPTAWIDPTVKLGKGNTIGAFTVIHAGVTIGDNNTIGSHTVIGGDGEIRDAHNFQGEIKIGSRNLINHHVTIDKPITGFTVVGDDNFIMTKAHLGHDVVISKGVTISSGAVRTWLRLPGLNQAIYRSRSTSQNLHTPRLRPRLLHGV